MASPSRAIEDQVVHNWSAGASDSRDVELDGVYRARLTGRGDQVDYFLLDARDLADSVWTPCDGEKGTHRCPEAIRSLPTTMKATPAMQWKNSLTLTIALQQTRQDLNMYVLNLREEGTLRVSVETDDPDADPDIHLLSGDDANACLTRAHESFNFDASPGRYLLIVDSWVNADGDVLDGHYRVSIDLEP